MSVRWTPLRRVLRLAAAEMSVVPESTYPMVGVLGHGRGLLLRETIRGADTSYKTLRRMSAGQIVYSRLKAFEGAFAVVGADGDGRFASGEFPNFDIDRAQVSVEWLGHLLHTAWFRARVMALSKGIGARRERLGVDQFLSIEIPLPDLGTQREIAARLDSVARTPDGGRLPVRLAALHAQTVMEACRAAPNVSFGHLFELQRRRVYPVPDERYREIGVRSFGRGIFVKDATTGEEIGAKRVFRVAEGDLVVSNIFAWEGAVARAHAEHDGLLGSHRFMTWTPRDERMTASFAAAFFTTRAGVALLADASPGSAGRNRTLAIRNLEAIRVPVPDRRTQERVTSQLDIVRQIERLGRQRDELSRAILPAARNEEFRKLLAS